jgi:predicted nucleic acid-binding protein
LIAVDTSVAIAAFATWHEAHAEAVRVVAQRPDLPAPCALEVYAVLTRLPPPHRAESAIVRDFLDRTFPGAHMGISGGASYDAVIAMIAVHHERELVTLDRRARPTYDRVGAAVRLIG